MKHIPQRIQRKRVKGWKMPPNTIYVGRGSKWGNPFRVVQYSDGKWAVKCDSDERQAEILTSTCRAAYDTKQEAQADAVMCYRLLIDPFFHGGSLDEFWMSNANTKEIIISLRGKNLACWCDPGDPCHADLLLKIANE
jgi:hypothetical protein